MVIGADPFVAPDGTLHVAWHDVQANAIVDMRLRTLVGLERQKIEDEYNGLIVAIRDLKGLLASEARRLEVSLEWLVASLVVDTIEGASVKRVAVSA